MNDNKENKSLNDNELRKVNGGFNDTSIYDDIKEGQTVKVRNIDNTFDEGVVINKYYITNKGQRVGYVNVRLNSNGTERKYEVIDVEIK